MATTGLTALLEAAPVATILAVVLAITGAVVVITGHYTFPQYLDDMKTLVGLLAVGRGAAAVGKAVVVQPR